MGQKLFVPGPVNIREEVLNKMAMPMISHRSEEASRLQQEITAKMQKIWYTNDQILLSTSSGTGLMEGAIRSCTRRRAAVFSVGAFGDRWYKIAQANKVPADQFSVEWGKALPPEMVEEVVKTGKYDLVAITHNETSTGVLNPIEEIGQVMKNYPEIVFCLDGVSSTGGVKIPVDELGVDICITSTQKALGLPPGMAICTMSSKAVKAAQQVETRGFYFDLLSLYRYVEERNYQYPSTPSLSHMFALNYQLDRILAEGLEERFRRHQIMAEYVRAWAKEYFELFPVEAFASPTLTTVTNTRQLNMANFNHRLKERGFVISNGYGQLKEKTFRIAHMGDTTLTEVKELLSAFITLLEGK